MLKDNGLIRDYEAATDRFLNEISVLSNFAYIESFKGGECKYLM